MARNRETRIGCLVAASCAAITAAGPAHANDVQWAEDCNNALEALYSFDVGMSVCITGDVDYTCPEEMGIQFPGADVYVVKTGDPNPFNSVPASVHMGKIMGGAGSFYSQRVWTGPLLPGKYDVVLDEHCDGVFDSDDARSVDVFAVGEQASCAGADPPNTCPASPDGWDWRPLDPGLAWGSKCRGACGADCPDTCTDEGPQNMCCEDPGGTNHVSCTFTGNKACGSHEGCRVHDECYDHCMETSTSPFWCMRGCDAEAAANWGAMRGLGWARGKPPYDYNLHFAGPASSSSGPGGCP